MTSDGWLCGVYKKIFRRDQRIRRNHIGNAKISTADLKGSELFEKNCKGLTTDNEFYIHTVYTDIQRKERAIMETVITRKVGNSVTVTIPKELNISIGREYHVYKGADDVIVFAPRIRNPLVDSDRVRMTDEFEEVRFLDTELE